MSRSGTVGERASEEGREGGREGGRKGKEVSGKGEGGQRTRETGGGGPPVVFVMSLVLRATGASPARLFYCVLSSLMRCIRWHVMIYEYRKHRQSFSYGLCSTSARSGLEGEGERKSGGDRTKQRVDADAVWIFRKWFAFLRSRETLVLVVNYRFKNKKGK